MAAHDFYLSNENPITRCDFPPCAGGTPNWLRMALIGIKSGGLDPENFSIATSIDKSKGKKKI